MADVVKKKTIGFYSFNKNEIFDLKKKNPSYVFSDYTEGVKGGVTSTDLIYIRGS